MYGGHLLMFLTKDRRSAVYESLEGCRPLGSQQARSLGGAQVLWLMAARMSWTFLTNHAQVLLALAEEPRLTARVIAIRVGVTERAVQRIIADLEEAGYIARAREGRVNVYRVDRERPMRHPAPQSKTMGALLRALEGPGASDWAE